MLTLDFEVEASELVTVKLKWNVFQSFFFVTITNHLFWLIFFFLENHSSGAGASFALVFGKDCDSRGKVIW